MAQSDTYISKGSSGCYEFRMDYKWGKNEIKDIYWAVILTQVKYHGDMDWSGKHEGSWK